MSYKVILLTSLLLLVIALILIWGWLIAFTILLMLGGIIYGIFHIWYENLPLAVIKVEGGHEIRLKYVRLRRKQMSLYQNSETSFKDGRNTWLTMMRVVKISEFPSETFSPLGSTTNAELTIDGEEFTFLMDKEWTRCPCDRKPPCWIGEEYTTRFIQIKDGIYWMVSINLVKLDSRYRRRGRRRHVPKEEHVVESGIPVFT